ncbi:Ribosomal RNA small subunit methyltransferase H [Mycobacterium talmoniae]|uniref:Ribosomal RNA small subunit methyltransferase H n=1 Tax=Mycobacterium talmoniae TaxID=1858794 RepID=A0A2S8BN84_9MYCO|nr:Ribosomal RNA small subunit methyltransferase H [Mycobacterium talmoniae]
MGDFGHVPVLLERCVALLTPALTRQHPDGSGAVLVDATLGAGGHAERFLSELPGLRLIGLDRDPTALDIAADRLAPFADRLTLVRTRYDGIADALAESGYAATGSIDGVLFDLGVSSMQLDRSERGFSYAQDAPLDMRMDPEAPLTAADILNTYDQAALTDILRRYGEERFASRIAAQVVRRRAHTPFTSTGELVSLLYQAIPAPARRTGGHPAKRTFQALRVAVNGELDSLRAALPGARSGTRSRRIRPSRSCGCWPRRAPGSTSPPSARSTPASTPESPAPYRLSATPSKRRPMWPTPGRSGYGGSRSTPTTGWPPSPRTPPAHT